MNMKQVIKKKTAMNKGLKNLQTKGAFFWDYPGIGILGIDSDCVLLEHIPFLEWTECYSVHSAPNSRMDLEWTI